MAKCECRIGTQAQVSLIIRTSSFDLRHPSRAFLTSNEVFVTFAFSNDLIALSVHQDFRRSRARIVIRRQRESIPTCVSYRQSLATLHLRQRALTGQVVCGLANGAYDVCDEGLPFDPFNWNDLVVRTVQAGPDQVVHARIHNYKLPALTLL